MKDQRCSRWYVQKKAKVGFPKACELVSAFCAAGYITEQPKGRFTVNATWSDIDELNKAFAEADADEEAEQRAKQALWDAQDDKGVLVKDHKRSPAYRNQMPFNEDAFAEILERIGQGETLAGILDDAPTLPTFSRWTQWLETDPQAEANRRRYYLARLARADALAQHVLDISDDSSDDTRVIKLPGSVESIVTDTQHIARQKLRVETRKWILAKAYPEFFSEDIDIHRDRDQLLRSSTTSLNMDALTPTAREKLTAFLEQVEADKAEGWIAA